MSFSSTAHLRDREAEWSRYFIAHRRALIRPLVTDQIIEEYANNPRGLDGPQSVELQTVLNFLRILPLEGFPIIYVEKPYAAYRVAVGVRSGVAPTIDWSYCARSSAEIEREVFIRRLRFAELR